MQIISEWSREKRDLSANCLLALHCATKRVLYLPQGGIVSYNVPLFVVVTTHSEPMGLTISQDVALISLTVPKQCTEPAKKPEGGKATSASLSSSLQKLKS